MRFTSLTRQVGIGSNSYLVETDAARVLLDSGMHPKEEGRDALPQHDLVPEEVDGLILTHAHLDHVGSLPVIQQSHPSLPVFLTPATAALSVAMLHNSVNVMQAKRVEMGIAEYPFFGHRDIDEIASRWEHRGYERRFTVDHAGTLHATFHDAGHILGSVGVTLESSGKRLFYSGDVNFEDQTLIKGALFPSDHAVDALILETTRGEHPRAPAYTRRTEENRFADALADTLARGGSVLVPVFAMGKTQEVLAMIHRFKLERRIPPATPVHIGGLSTKMTVIHDEFADDSRRCRPGFRIFEQMDIATAGRRGAPIPQDPGCIYALSSGMMSENTVSNRFARTFLTNPRNSVCFVGYCDPETPGYRVKHSAPGERVLLDPREPEVARRCELGVFDFSGHAPREHLLDFACRLRPRRVFLVHGDEGACQWFRGALTAALPDTETIIPQPGITHAF